MRSAFLVLAATVLCVSAAASSLIPTVTNPGFESGTEGWGWLVYGGAQVSFSVDTINPHSGKQCLVFRNTSAISPNVYGRLVTHVSVVPNTKYELSCWVRGEEVSPEPGGFHVTDWNSYTMDFPTGTFDWKRVSFEFTTHTGQHTLALGINVANKCKALAVDDVSLKPLGGQLQGGGITGIILAKPTVIGLDSIIPITVLIEDPKRAATAVDASITVEGKRVDLKHHGVKAEETQIDWEWHTGKAPYGKYEVAVRVLGRDGGVLASGSTPVEIVDSPFFAELDQIEARKREFDALYEQCKAKRINLAYPTATKTMLEQLIPLTRTDIRAGLDWRVSNAIPDFNRSLDNGIATLKAYLQDPSLAPVTRRYQTGNMDIDGLSFIGDRIDSTGKKDRGPVFFVGHGHFVQVRKDVPIFPGYGVNIIQLEIGPAHVLTAENKVDLTAVKDIQRVLDDAAKHNIMVNVLLSPHYFPAWAAEKWPHLLKGGGGFLGYCVDDPAAKQMLEKYLRIVVPMLKDKPALHSFCLTNEPVFPNIANCDNTKGLWIDYLTRTHGDISTLNKRYETSYASFADVPYSGDPQAYDWIVYDQQRFAGWHRWMADIIHEMAPDVPTHAKVMSNQLNVGAVSWATDQELFGNLLEINGNDCYWFPGNAEWPIDPWLQNTSYDIQRSFARKPVFNSEHHISPDGATHYIAPETFRSSLWQGAIHGQGASTLWVWERPMDNATGVLGHAMERPGCAETVGVTCIDLNRFADEVTALETARARVAIVYSMSSIIRRGNEHAGAIWRTYHALNFCGVKIDFISEKQLAAGKGGDYKVIIVPEAETLTDAAFEGIRSLPASTRLLLLNECFSRNEYGKRRDANLVKAVRDNATVLKDGDGEKVLWPQVREILYSTAVLPTCSVVDANTGEPIWGVEWLPAYVNGRTVINMINLRSKPYQVKVLRYGNEVEAYDLFSLGGKERAKTLKPLTPVLAEIR